MRQALWFCDIDAAWDFRRSLSWWLVCARECCVQRFASAFSKERDDAEEDRVDRRKFLKARQLGEWRRSSPARPRAPLRSARNAAGSYRAGTASGDRSCWGLERRGTYYGSSWVGLHGRRVQVAGHRIHRRESRVELPRACTNRSSITAATRRRSSSRAATKKRRWRWRTAMPRWKESRWWCLCTAPWACSTRRWLSTTPIATACRCIVIAGQHAGCDDAASRRGVGPQRAGRRGHGARFREVGRSCRCRCSISRSRRCAPTRSR